MIAAFSTPSNRNKSFILLAICGLLAIAAAAVGIDDNPPGILLAFLSAAAFVFAFVHSWRTAKKFMFLLLASVIGFVLYIILNIILDTAAQNPATSAALQDFLQSPVINTLSLIIVMVCAAAFIVGVVGSVAMFIRNLRRPA
jgi:membrane-anchored glycerophosphoryl diester phosphodiesterase (GDPDase)